MASVWDVYNEHWGKETFKILKRRHEAKEGIEETIHHLWCWMELMPRDTERPFEVCQSELRTSLRYLGFSAFDYDDNVRFKMLKTISKMLCPPVVDPQMEDEFGFKTFDVVGSSLERSEDTPYYYSPPVEKTLLKNLGGRQLQMHFKKGYDCNRIRALDAILALR